jgi:hypothetical protein
MRIRIRITAISLEICGFAIWDWYTKEILRICNLRINHYRFSDLRFADCPTSEIADLLKRNEPNNLRICGLRNNIKIFVSTSAELTEFLFLNDHRLCLFKIRRTFRTFSRI